MIKYLMVVFALLCGMSCSEDWRKDRQTVKRLEQYCSHHCSKLDGSYIADASENSFGCVFYYKCLCYPKSEVGKKSKHVIEIKVSEETLKILPPEKNE